MATGKVIGGHYLNAVVEPKFGSTLILQAGFKFRKLTPEQIAGWTEVVTDSSGNPVSTVGQAVARVALPGRLGKAASAAVGATFDAMGPSHVIQVDWVDGKQSLIKLPDSLFNHFALMVQERKRATSEPTAETRPSQSAGEKPTVAEQAFSLVSGIIKDRLPNSAAPTNSEPDLAAQLTKLAALRDNGVITDEEFAAKKAELLARF